MPTDPPCRNCGSLLAAERAVQVTETETVTRRLYDCGAVEAAHVESDGWAHNSQLAPCGDIDRRVAADREQARADTERTRAMEARVVRAVRAVRVRCDDCDGVGGITLIRDGEQAIDQCVRCGGAGWLWGVDQDHDDTCQTCDGDGWVHIVGVGRVACPDCGGQG